jgi:hypothetical protein
MLCFRRARRMVITVAMGAVAAQTSPAFAMDPWEQLLRTQLRDEKTCYLAETPLIVEMPLGDGVVLSGRARCIDGREFDFSQSQPHMKFDLRTCDVTYC